MNQELRKLKEAKIVKNQERSRAKMPLSVEIPVTNAERCTIYILQKIESGEIGPETRLGEPSLAQEIGVDRASVRTAFERLSATGILERRPRSGTYLKQRSLSDLSAANQVRRGLETLGARLAAEHATDEELDRLITMARLLDQLTEQYINGQMAVWSSIRSLEIEFHTMVARFSHNPYLLSMMNRDSFLQVCFPFLSIAVTMSKNDFQDFLVDSVTNLDVAEAIFRRDPEKAAAVMSSHVEGSLHLYEKALSHLKS